MSQAGGWGTDTAAGQSPLKWHLMGRAEIHKGHPHPKAGVKSCIPSCHFKHITTCISC